MLNSPQNHRTCGNGERPRLELNYGAPLPPLAGSELSPLQLLINVKLIEVFPGVIT